MIKKIAYLYLFLATPAFAIFCPNSFNSINLGDSLEQVLQICGAPAARNDYKKTESLPQEWIYYLRSNFDTSNTKVSVTFNTDNQVINIEIINGGLIQSLCNPVVQAVTDSRVAQNCQAAQMPQNVNSTAICGSYIKIGDSKETVESACGKPSFVNQSQGQSNAQATEITELRYNSTPPITLYFENGLLVDRLY